MFCYSEMKTEVISSADSRSSRITKDRYNKVRKLLSKKRDHNEINESMMYGISQMMNHLIPKGRHFDDVRLLEFTVEYLKQRADFQRGVGFCAEETKAFLKQHIFDRRKMNILFQKLEQRIDLITQHQTSDTIDTFQQESIFDHVTESSTGVLLDLSMKQNRLRDATSNSYITTTPTINSVCNKIKKREILDKIRQKILNKRRMSDSSHQKVEIIQNEIMWRPWRY
ncbi:uncharacterized protein LOC119071305 [Bradysia coprophila]|uniref:uncharacterized protein LOC119071305 n=1 Tax=Bradysia coprophila TaxID=38358 RepID=UPI00187DB18B|nr:uncharacterized protein LOC119071305 [Bradysia coprophila]